MKIEILNRSKCKREKFIRGRQTLIKIKIELKKKKRKDRFWKIGGYPIIHTDMIEATKNDT